MELGARIWRDLVCRRNRGRRLLGLGSRWLRSVGRLCWFLYGIGKSWGDAGVAWSFCIWTLVARNSGRRIGRHHRSCLDAGERLALAAWFLRLRILRNDRHPSTGLSFLLGPRLRIVSGLRVDRILPGHFLPRASSLWGPSLSTSEALPFLA